MYPVLSQMNPIHILISHLPEIKFVIFILHHRHRPSDLLLLFKLVISIFANFSIILYCVAH
jgi:hypothetical protein